MQANSNSRFKHLVLAGLLATVGLAASAQGVAPPAANAAPAAPMAEKAGPPHGGHGPRGERMGRHDPAKMQAYVAKRLTALKEKLKLTPAQEPAWTSFAGSMQPPAPGTAHGRIERGEMAKLTTPERIDKMRAMRAQRAAEMDKRGDAAKTFYAALTPEQQKVFDANAMQHRPGGRGEHRRGGPDAQAPKG
jgi:protein CpxP